ncbi:ABC transporter permease [Hathewaya histolytica]|uniref:ABC transporter permease n=1 Tax=Hathewaya histolytica TaxID=1498 RepID=UPI003B68257E
MIKSFFKKSIFIVITFTVISFIFSICTSLFQSIIEVNKENTFFLSDKSLKLLVQNIPNLDKSDFKVFQSLNKDILMYKDLSKPIYKGIYFSGDKTPNVPMKNGRFFNRTDFQDNKKVAVIGKEVLKECSDIHGKHYLNTETGQYLVIGIMGYKDKETYLDDSIYLNLNSIFKENELNFSTGSYYIDAGKDTIKTVNKFTTHLKSKYQSANITSFVDDSIESPFMDILRGTANILGLTILIVLCLALNTVSLTTEWIESKQRELAIRKAYGGTDKAISKRIIIEYELIVTTSFILGFILYVISVKLNILGLFNGRIYFLSTIIAFLFCLIVGAITAIIPIKKAMKLEVSSILR